MFFVYQLKLIIRNSFLSIFVDYFYKKKLLREWAKEAGESKSPNLIKKRIIKDYAKKFGIHIFIETGTCLGQMVYANRDIFQRIYSIELDKQLWSGAQKLFRSYEHITILHGDSTKVLPLVLRDINEPVLFWLDAHYSGGFTTKGDKETPILNEIESIFSHRINNHVVLIDDARLFVGKSDYPTLETLRDFIQNRDPKLNFEVYDDIIRIHRL